MAPLWLLVTPSEMATVAAGVYFLGSLVVTAFAVGFINHRSTVDRSASGAFALAAGVDRWVAESERKQPPARQPRDARCAVVPVGPSATRTPT